MVRRVDAARYGYLLVVLAGCGDDKRTERPYFDWERGTVGAFDIDRLAPDDPKLLAEIDHAATHDQVTMFYGHARPDATTPAIVDAVLARAEANDLPVYTFADLAAGIDDPPVPRRGICLSFDDTEIDGWYALREVFDRHAARATFFVTEYADFTADGRAKLHALFDEGYSIEAHGIHHANFLEWTGSIDDYVAQEIVPSFDVLRADGFTPVAYAHPNGAHSIALDDAILDTDDSIAIVRSISGRPK